MASALNAAIPFLILPILTTYLSPEQYGIVSTFMVFNSIFVIVVGAEQYNFISVNYYTKSREEISRYISAVLLTSTCIFIILAAFIFVVTNLYNSIFELEAKWLLVSIVVAFFQALSQLSLTIWQLGSEPLHYGSFQVLNSLVNYLVSLFFVIQLDLGEDGRIWGITIASIVFGIYSLFSIYNKGLIKFSWSMEITKSALLFSLPLIPHAFAGWINTASDRLILNHYAGTGVTGIYSVYYQVAMVISLVASSFNRAFMPYLFKSLNENNHKVKVKLVKYTYLYYALLLMFAICLGIATPIILSLLVDGSYLQSITPIYWIMISFVADGLYFGVVNYLFYAKKTKYVAAITFSSCIIHLLASFLFIPRFGIMGAAYSSALSYFFSFIVSWIVSANTFPMPWFNREVFSKQALK